MKKHLFILCLFFLTTSLLQGQNISNALDFDGTEDYVSVMNGTALLEGLDEFSMCGWVYPTNSNAVWPDFDGFFGIKDEGVCDFYLAQINGTGLEARLTTNVATYTINPFEISEVELEEWHHYALVYTGFTLELYLDGELDGFVDASGSIDYADKEITFGKLEFFDNDFFLDGMLDEITFWNKALTEEEIQAAMCITGDPAGYEGLVAYYDFNEESGTVLPDYFGNYDGILTAMTGDEWIESEVCQSGVDITFVVTDEVTSEYLEGAEVVFDGISKTTDNNGEAIYSNYDPGTYSWEVSMDEYYASSGELEVADEDITQEVALAPVIYYNITFEVTEDPGSMPIDSAIVNLNGLLQYTDQSGITTFTDYLPGSYTYNVSKPGYFLVPGTAVVADENLYIEVTMIWVGINEDRASSISIFPNPANERLYIESHKWETEMEAQLMTLSGISIRSAMAENGKLIIDLDGISAGIYLLEAKVGDDHVIKRVVVQ
jgi:hypothetical protein